MHASYIRMLLGKLGSGKTAPGPGSRQESGNPGWLYTPTCSVAERKRGDNEVIDGARRFVG